MSTEEKPPESQQPPRQSQSPPRSEPPREPAHPAGQRMQIQPEEVMKQAEQTLSQLGIDIKVALKVLIIAAVSGLLAALLDEILGLPTNALRFSFGWMIAALNGITYARIKDNYALPGLIASAVAGLVAFLVWFIVMEIIGGKYGLSYNINVFKAILTGAIVGMIGFGWLWVVRTVPDKLPI